MRPNLVVRGLLLAAAGLNGAVFAAGTVTPYADFVDPREPPPYRALSSGERDAFELGHAVFNTQWVPAGTPRAQRRDGLGPLFNAASCDACHNNGARGQGPGGSGPLPVGLVIQLSNAGGPDPGYGHVFNTAAIDGFPAEGTVSVSYDVREGRYPDGQPWRLRVPRYRLDKLLSGPILASTVIKPRLAPPLFGVGLLDAVPEAALMKRVRNEPSIVRGSLAHAGGEQRIGRFGWQGDSPSLADQTARALSREMGLRSRLIPKDDCGIPNERCRKAAAGGEPEVSDEFLAALVAFQRTLAIPRADARAKLDTASEAKAAAYFSSTGCIECHAAELPVDALGPLSRIQPYTDLLLHDMGPDLADRDAAGSIVDSRWRTAPLWGIGHLSRDGERYFLMHDGRARSIEEAVLWHAGEAAAARDRFTHLAPELRRLLIDWVARR